MPGTTDGARQYGQRLGGKEIAGKHRGKTSVLHSHLNTDGALLGCIESGTFACQPTQKITQGIVAENHRKSPEEKHQATGYEIIVNRRDHTAYDNGQTGYADTRHEALDGRKVFFLAIYVIEGAADGYRNNRDDEDVDEHSHCIYMDNLASRNLHQQRSHYWSQNGRGAGHSYGEGHVAMTEITHDVARYATRTTTYQQNAERQRRVKMPYMNQRVGHTRHDDKLGTGTDENIERTLSQNLEIIGGQGETHRKHNNAENDGLGCSAHPVEGMWEEECKHSYTYYKNRCIIGQPAAESLK